MKLVYTFLFMPIFCWARSPITPEDRQKANSYYASADWKNVAEIYKKINLHNSATQKWMQTWVHDKGAVIEFLN